MKSKVKQPKQGDRERRKIKRLAANIARYFFTDWDGKPTVRRLVIEQAGGPKFDGAGYCMEAVRDTIETYLFRAMAKKRSKRSKRS